FVGGAEHANSLAGTQDLVAVHHGAGLEAILGATVGTERRATGGDVDVDLGVQVPDRRVRTRTRHRQVVGADFDDVVRRVRGRQGGSGHGGFQTLVSQWWYLGLR